MTTFAAFDDIDAFEQYLAALAPGTIVGQAMTQTHCPLAQYAKAIDIRLPRLSGASVAYYTQHDVQRADPLTRWQAAFIARVDQLALDRMRAAHDSGDAMVIGYANDPEMNITREDCLDVLHRVRALGYSSR